MYKGIKGQIEELVKRCNKFLDYAKQHKKEHQYKEIINEYETNFKESVKHEDTFHGFTFIEVLNDIENGIVERF